VSQAMGLISINFAMKIAPSKKEIKMKSKTLLLTLTWFLVMPFYNAKAQQPASQPQQTNELFIKYQSEEYNKRNNTLSANAYLQAFIYGIFLVRFMEKYENKEERDAEVKKNALFILHWSRMTICTSNVFWKDDKPGGRKRGHSTFSC
jgi:hypothetical protein